MAKAKYTYLYNGEIVRNSNRLYKYGLVNHYNKVVACSSSSQGVLKEKTYWLNVHKRNLEYYIKHNKKEDIDYTKQDIENVEKWHVVELEVKEN
jgi:hypothetical protein